MADQYVLRVTAGTNYDVTTHKEIAVNTSTPTHISSPLIDADINVRIQDYTGLPKKSPSTSPYFSQPPHSTNKDQYSISFKFTPKAPTNKGQAAAAGAGAKGISASDLQFGNDFDHPIRDRLPPGFSTALNIVKWWIDPGLDGDPYADQPYLYGPALSSFNTIHVLGSGDASSSSSPLQDPAKGGLFVTEGGDDAGLKIRSEIGAPADAKARMKWALKADSKQKWVWEYGKTYAIDFFNPYISFADFSLRLPGFQVSIMKYWDGQGLRYVLRNKSTKEVYLVIFFTLYRKEDVNEDGTLKAEASGSKTSQFEHSTAGGAGGKPEHDHDFDHEKALEEARKHLSTEDLSKGPSGETSADDVD